MCCKWVRKRIGRGIVCLSGEEVDSEGMGWIEHRVARGETVTGTAAVSRQGGDWRRRPGGSRTGGAPRSQWPSGGQS
jgi:hypothetical protein